MIFKIQLFKSSVLFIALICSQSLFAQSELSADDLFQQARSAAFDKKDYTLATELSKKALIISPEYADIRIFLGRVYTWWNKADSARACFNEVLSKQPDNEDASAAYADLEYWNKNPSKALSLCEEGLAFHPQSKVLMLKKAKSLVDLKRFKEANDVLDELLKNDSQNAEVRALSKKIKEDASKNTIGLTYDFVNFDKQFPDPWHIIGLDYSRSTAMGPFTGRLNYANRFKTNAVQFEADAYPKISKTFYSYINAGISDKSGVFPQYRAGFSLYANLPESFEAEMGFRYLHFNDATWIYTGSLGKYFKNYWFNFKTYITPANQSVFNSYILTARYYYKKTDYFGLGLGTGISPDERSNNVQLANSYQLKSYRISADYRNTFYHSNVLLVRFSWLNQQYLPKETGNQYVFSLGYQRVF
jgi:YaiO family outer membrane protein